MKTLIDSQAPYYTNGKNGHHKNGHSPKQAPADSQLRPHNFEAEEFIIGCLLTDPDSILKISTLIDKKDFYIERHGWIYDAIKSLYQAGKPTADILSVSDELKRRGQLDKIGGDAYLTGFISNSFYTPAYLEYYTELVRRASRFRSLIKAGTAITRLGFDPGQKELGEVMDKAEEMIFEVTSNFEDGGPQHIGSGISRYYDRVEYLSQHQDRLVGLPTGLIDLDNLLGGLQRSDMITLAGRPGMGKTAMALSIARNAARKWNKRVLVFSLEMSEEQLIQRLVSQETGIDSQRLRLGKIKDDEWPLFYEAIQAFNTAPIWIDDTPAITVLELRSKARRIHAEHGLDLLIVDYLQLMNGTGKNENRTQEVSAISRSIKALARELNIPILALSQLSRQVESRQDKRPMLSDLRESGNIEQDSDIVMFIYRDEIYNPDTTFPNIAEIIVGKHRSGPTGTFSVYFKKHLSQFVDLALRGHSLGAKAPMDNEPVRVGDRSGDWQPHAAGQSQPAGTKEGRR